MGHNPDEVLPPVHHQLADCNLAGLLQRLADDRIALVRIISVGGEVIGLLPKAAVDLGFVDEAHHVDGVLRL